MRFGAKGLMSTLMRVRISSDAPRCTVQFGALDPRCTMVQVHGDPNEPSLGAGAAGAPCVTLWCRRISRRSREIDRDHAGRRQGGGDAHAHDRYRRSWQDKACACACAWAILRYLEITRDDATVGEGRSRRDLGRSRVDQTRSLRGRTCGHGGGVEDGLSADT